MNHEKRRVVFSGLRFKNLRNKRGGDNLLMKEIIVLIAIFAIMVAVIFFFTKYGSGELVKNEITAKQLCVIITGAENGTTLNITSNLIIEKNGQDIVVKKSTIDFGYSYPCNIKNFEIEKEEANTIIKISE